MARTQLFARLQRLFREHAIARAAGRSVSSLRDLRAEREPSMDPGRRALLASVGGTSRRFFCGEHTSTDFQGFMEGAAAEGKRAARQVAKLVLGKDVADD